MHIVSLTCWVFFRCPINGKVVRHVAVEEPHHDDEMQFQSVRCATCGLVHMVNVTTGKTIEQDLDATH